MAGAVVPAGPQVGSKAYIGNLQWWTTDAQLENLCREFGEIMGVKIFADEASGKSKGAAQIDFAEPGAATACKTALHGCEDQHYSLRMRCKGMRIIHALLRVAVLCALHACMHAHESHSQTRDSTWAECSGSFPDATLTQRWCQRRALQASTTAPGSIGTLLVS